MLSPVNRLPAVAAPAAKRLTPLWGLIGLLHVVKSDRATRARFSNPAGPPLRSGLAQEGLGRAVKVADREVGLTRTPQDLACGAPAPEARGRRVGPALPNRPAHGSQHPKPCLDEPSCIAPGARTEAGAETAARLECLLETSLIPTTPRRASPRCTTPNFRTKIGDFPHQPPPKTF